MYSEVIINSNARTLNRVFDYIVPEKMESSIKIGSRVFVPFGNTKKLEDGFVIGLKENSEFANKEIALLYLHGRKPTTDTNHHRRNTGEKG